MSKFKKSLKMTGTCLRFCGSFCIIPTVMIADEIKEWKRRGHTYSDIPITHWLLMIYPGIPIFAFMSALSLAGGVAGGALCLAGGIVAGGYYGLQDIKGKLSPDQSVTFNEEHADITEDITEDSIESSHATIVKQLTVKPIDPENTFSVYTLNYIQSFNPEKLYSLQIENLKLTVDEGKLFNQFLDPITSNVIDIPVRLNEELYDLSTLLVCFHKDKKDPIKRVPFTLEHISPDRKTNAAIQTLIKSIKDNRNMNRQELELSKSNQVPQQFVLR